VLGSTPNTASINKRKKKDEIMSDEKKNPALPLAALLDTIQQLVRLLNDQDRDLNQVSVAIADKDGELFHIEQMHFDIEKMRLYLVRSWTTNEDAVYDKQLAEQVAKTDQHAEQVQQNAEENEKLAEDDSAWEDPSEGTEPDETDNDDNWDDD
jgi:hypothetical protein